MFDGPYSYLIVYLLIFGLNAFPAFMPPTWVVLSFFFIRYDLQLLPTVIVGALAATSGRLVLYLLAKSAFRSVIPEKMRLNLEALGGYFKTHQNFSIAFIAFYGFLPIPSNQAFITFGLSNMPIKLIAAAFFLARLASYSIMITATDHFTANLETIFSRHFGHAETFFVDILGFLIILGISKINWRKVLKK